MNNNEVKECAIELKYAPRKCEYFCMGDCCLPDTNRSCGTDKDNCEYYNLYTQLLQLKAEKDQLTKDKDSYKKSWECANNGLLTLTQKLEKARGALKNITIIGTKCYDCSICPHQDENNYCDMECRQGMTDLAQQTLKELE